MAAKENFFKAMKELTGINGTEGAQPPLAGQAQVNVVPPVENKTINPFFQQPAAPEKKEDGTGDKEPTDRNGFFDRQPPKPPEPPKGPAATVISASVVITGEVKSTGDLEVLGMVKGPITTTGNMNIQGKILGDIEGNNIVLSGCAVQGSIVATGDVNVDATSVVVGDIKALNLNVNGKIKGSLSVQDRIDLNKDAIVDGNASSRFISMSQGARLNGNVSVISEETEDAGIFDIEFDV